MVRDIYDKHDWVDWIDRSYFRRVKKPNNKPGHICKCEVVSKNILKKKHHIVGIGIFLILIISCSSVGQKKTKDKASSATDSINIVFKKYTDAIQTGNGDEALKYTSQVTINYYDTLIYHALYSDENDLNKINILTRTAILRIRHTNAKTYLDYINGKRFLIDMWASQKINQNSSDTLVCSACKFEKMTATCNLDLNRISTGMNALFHKENNEWKIDITSIGDRGIAEMNEEIKRMGVTETEYIIKSLDQLDNVQVTKEMLYKPLKQKE